MRARIGPNMAFWKRRPSSPTPDPSLEPVPLPSARSADAISSVLLFSGDARTDGKTVEVLLDAIARVSASRDLDELLDYVVDTAISTTSAERGFLFLAKQSGEKPSVRNARDSQGRPLDEDTRWSTSIVAKVVDSGVPMHTMISGQGDMDLGQSVMDLKLRAVMCVPFGVRSTGDTADRLGALYVDTKAASREFTDGDLALFHALAQHVAIAVENAQRTSDALEKARLEESMALATEIQKSMIPKDLKVAPGFEAFGWFLPAEHATGDFYDVAQLSDGRSALMLGDATGHGVGPALVVASAQAALRSYCKILDNPSRIVQLVDEDLAERMDGGTFLTLCLVVVGKDGSFETVDAGHGCTLVYRASTGSVEALKSSGPALGVAPGFEHATEVQPGLEPGDMVLLFSDGLSEAAHGDAQHALFGEERISEVLQEAGQKGEGPRALCKRLSEAALEFSGGRRDDDWTLMALRRNP